MDSRKVSKTITYRILSIIIELTIIYLATHNANFSIRLTALLQIVNTIIYYMHEELYSRWWHQ